MGTCIFLSGFEGILGSGRAKLDEADEGCGANSNLPESDPPSDC